MSKSKSNRVQLHFVDDDPLIRKILETKFKDNSNYDLHSYNYGEELLNQLIKSPVLKWKLNIIVLENNFSSLDIKRKDGIEIIKYIKEIIPKAHIIVLSSNTTDNLKNTSKILNLDGCITKNQNAFLRLQNMINSIVSKDELKQKKKQVKMFLIIFAILVTTMALVFLLKSATYISFSKQL